MAIRKQKFGKRPFTIFEKERYEQLLDRNWGPGFAARNQKFVTAYLQRRDDATTMAQCIASVRQFFDKLDRVRDEDGAV